jgi:amidohydrolase
VEIIVESITPAVINHPELSTRVQKVVQTIFPQATLDNTERTMGSEDMAFMMDDIPGCYFFIGSSNSEKGFDAKHHHPRFDFDESALTIGAALMTAAILDLLR